VSEFLRNLSHNSPWLTQPELIEIVASSMDVSPRDRRRVANFNIRVRILRASEAQKPAAPASTPAKS
jgi:type IV pilus assembly protein PilN